MVDLNAIEGAKAYVDSTTSAAAMTMMDDLIVKEVIRDA